MSQLVWNEELCRVILEYKVGMTPASIDYLLEKEPFETHSLELLTFCHEFDVSLTRLLLIEKHKNILTAKTDSTTL